MDFDDIPLRAIRGCTMMEQKGNEGTS